MAENMLTGGGGLRTDFYTVPRTAPANTNPLTMYNDAVAGARNETALQSQQFELARQQVGEMRNMFGSLAMKPDLSPNDFTAAAARMVSLGIPAAQIAPELSRIHQIAMDHAGAPDKMLSALQGEAKQMHANTLAAAEKIGLIYGQPFSADTGGNLLMGNRSVQTGLPVSGTSIPMTMSPSLKVSRFNGVSNGVPFSAPNVGAFTPTGDLPPNAPVPGASPAITMAPRGVSSAPVSVSQAPPPIAGAPAPRGFTTMQPAGPPPGAPAMPGFPAGAVQSQQGPGVDATANAQAVANQDRARQLQEAAGRAPEIKAVLDRMQAHAESFAGGPASPYLKQAGGLINQGATLAGFQPPITSQAAREGFDKDAAMLAGMQAGALGGTDASKQMASLMTPSSLNTPEGVRNLLAAHRGNQDAMMAKAQAWDAYRSALPSGQADYAHFENAFNKTFSPLAFSLPYVSKAERQKIWNAMPAGDQARVQQAYDEAKKKGYLRGPASTAPEPR